MKRPGFVGALFGGRWQQPSPVSCAVDYKDMPLASNTYRPEDRLPQPRTGWDHFGGGWPTPFHTFFCHYQDVDGPTVDKWSPYLNAYHKHFERFRGKQLTFVEVGVQSGGSHLMWRWYFGPGLRYIGIDINPECKRFRSEWAEIVIGDAEDPAFWKKFVKKYGSADILLDDGGHQQSQMLGTFR